MFNDFDIESKIRELFCADNSPMKFKAIDVQSSIANLSRPALTVAVVSGKFEGLGAKREINETARVVVTLVFKNVSSEVERRKVCHASVQYVVQKLNGNDLGLEIEPLTAKSWRETTSEEHLGLALMVVEIEFETRFTITPDAARHSYRELESIWSTFIDGEDGWNLEEAHKLENGRFSKLEDRNLLLLENRPVALMESKVDFTNGEEDDG